MSKRANTDMTVGSPMRNIIAFTLPLLLGNLLQQLYNIVDSLVVGNYVGKIALAAVGAGFPIMFMLSSIFMGLGMGATIMISQYYGAEDYKSVGKTVDTLYAFLVAGIIPISILGFFAAGPMLQLMKVPPDTIGDATLYMQILFVGVFAVVGYNVNAGVLYGIGDSKAPLLFLIIATVINIILDLVFVVVFGMGVEGVAIATIIAQAFSWIFGIFYINKKYDFLNVNPFRFRFDKGMFRTILKLGLPSALQQSIFSLGVMLMQTLVNSFGSDFIAGYNVANKLDMMVFLPIQSLAAAVSTFVGQNIGAGKPENVKHGVKSAMLLGFASCIVTGAIMLLFGRQCIMLFNSEPAVVEAGMAYITRVIPFYCLVAVMFVLNSTMRGAGAVMVPTIVSLVSLWCARVPAAYWLAANLGRDAMFYSYAIGWVMGDIFLIWYYMTGKWKNRTIVNKPVI